MYDFQSLSVRPARVLLFVLVRIHTHTSTSTRIQTHTYIHTHTHTHSDVLTQTKAHRGARGLPKRQRTCPAAPARESWEPKGGWQSQSGLPTAMLTHFLKNTNKNNQNAFQNRNRQPLQRPFRANGFLDVPALTALIQFGADGYSRDGIFSKMWAMTMLQFD